MIDGRNGNSNGSELYSLRLMIFKSTGKLQEDRSLYTTREHRACLSGNGYIPLFRRQPVSFCHWGWPPFPRVDGACHRRALSPNPVDSVSPSGPGRVLGSIPGIPGVSPKARELGRDSCLPSKSRAPSRLCQGDGTGGSLVRWHEEQTC